MVRIKKVLNIIPINEIQKAAWIISSCSGSDSHRLKKKSTESIMRYIRPHPPRGIPQIPEKGLNKALLHPFPKTVEHRSGPPA